MSDPFSQLDTSAKPAGVSPAVAHHAARLGFAVGGGRAGSPSSPRSAALSKITALKRRGVLTDKDVATLKDATVDGKDVSSYIKQLEACAPTDRFTIDSILLTVPRPSEIVRTNSFRALAGRKKRAESDPFGTPVRSSPLASGASPGSFSKLAARKPASSFDDAAAAAAPTATPEKPAGGDWWDQLGATTVDEPKTASPGTAKGAKPPPPPQSKGFVLDVGGDDESGESDSGGGTGGAGGPPAETDAARAARERSAAKRRAGRRVKKESVELPEHRGPIWVRFSKLMVKKWNRRFAVLRNGMFVVFEDEDKEAVNEPLDVYRLESNYILTDMKVTTNKPRIYYREIAALKHGVSVDDADDRSRHRIVKFGCDTLGEFEDWAKVFKATLDGIREEERRREADALAVDTVMHPADLMVSATESPNKRTMRRTGSKSVLTSSNPTSTNVRVYLLDDSTHSIHVEAGALVQDVCVGIRDKFGLESDADFSLFIREHGDFTCLPDATTAEDAVAMASSDTRELVYKRRICLPHSGSVDEEAMEAETPDQAAHYFLIIDAVYNVVRSHYIVEPDVGIHLGALQYLWTHGAFDAGTARSEVTARLDRELATFASAQLMHQVPRSTLVARIAEEYEKLGSRTVLSTQKEYLDIVSALPEYGSSFFRADCGRKDTLREGDPGTEETPPWLEVLGEGELTPVLTAFNGHGVYMRPRPPVHGEPAIEADLVELEPTWWLHQIRAIEVWGVKKTRPVFTYRVREQNVVLYELRSQQYQEMAAVLHMYVFQLLAQREGREVATKRRRSTDGGADDMAAAARAAEAAKAQAQNKGKSTDLPKEWSEIRDPITGKACWWNSKTRVTVWSRPDPAVTDF